MEDFLDRLENPFILLHEIRWFNNTFTSENQKVRNFFLTFFIFWKFLSILIPIMGIIWTTCILRNFMFSLFRGTISASITNLTVECFFIQNNSILELYINITTFFPQETFIEFEWFNKFIQNTIITTSFTWFHFSI